MKRERLALIERWISHLPIIVKELPVESRTTKGINMYLLANMQARADDLCAFWGAVFYEAIACEPTENGEHRLYLPDTTFHLSEPYIFVEYAVSPTQKIVITV